MDFDNSQWFRRVLTDQLSKNLQELIELKAINLICVFEGVEVELSQQSQHWSFGDNFVIVGDKHYSLHKLVSFTISNLVLTLHF